MAVVRFSEELKDSIIDNAKKLFESRLKAVRETAPDVCEAVTALVYSPYMPFFTSLPEEFFTTSQEVEVTVHHKGRNIDVMGKLSKPYPKVDSELRTPDGARLKAYYRIDITIPDSGPYAPYHEQMVAWQERIDAVIAQRDEFVSGVKQVVEVHSTLAPALKAWPPLWDLVPETFKERHRKVVERTKSNTAAIDVDLTALTSTVVASKLIK